MPKIDNERRLALKARISKVLEDARAEQARKEAAGLCQWPSCSELACKDPTLFFGSDHCAPHAREAEIECLVEDQEDDAHGRFQRPV